MLLRPGLKLKAPGTTAEVIVISGPTHEVVLTCAGAPMSPDGVGEPGAGDGELVIGKRYSDGVGTIELLCTSGGPGPLALDGRRLETKAAKALPSSD